jgi:archaemetzincin
MANNDQLRLIIIIFITALVAACTSKTNNPADFKQEINGLEQLDVPLAEPKPGDWLYEHKEQGQTFEVYKSSNPVTPTGDRSKIYLLPVGDFIPIEDSILLYTADYLNIYFGLTVVIAEPLSDTIVPPNARRRREDGHEQLRTTHFLNTMLPARIPDDAIVVMAITAKDLYPSESWNFVFGQATIKNRVGVSSFYRFETPGMDSLSYPLCLERFIKTSAHEIGHMFSIQHCTHAICGMNGVNGVSELDQRPNRLCSECLKKLEWNLKFSVTDRAALLESYFIKHKLKVDADLASRDLAIIRKNHN